MNFYFTAADILDRLDKRAGSIKGFLASVPEKDRKRTAALVIETLKYKPVLRDVLEATKLLKEERKKITSQNLALLLVHDLLLADGIQAGDGPIKQAVLRHKTRLRGELEKKKIKLGARCKEELAQTCDPRAEQIPRYVRVNTIRWSLTDAVSAFASQGFVLSPDVSDMSPRFSKDEHIPNLLLFPPKSSFTDDALYKTGKIILQDKASCFPAVILDPPRTKDAVVIDATAAPGNKTSHLCALMNNQGKLFAFEKDAHRFGTLRKMVSKAGCTNVELVNADFLTIDPVDPKYSQVTHILLDPSCSGSGIVNRLDYLLETEAGDDEATRLSKLASFQLLMIRHAMKFPKATKIVYSTCSVHAMENEHVVCQALQSDEAKTHSFMLAPPEQVLPQWPRRGLGEEMDTPGDGLSLVRCQPGEDATNGFFVSCFIRKQVNGKRRRTDEDAISVAKKKRRKNKSNEP